MCDSENMPIQDLSLRISEGASYVGTRTLFGNFIWAVIPKKMGVEHIARVRWTIYTSVQSHTLADFYAILMATLSLLVSSLYMMLWFSQR